jgi:hypothetical protein
MIHDNSSIPQSRRPLHQQRIGCAKLFIRSHNAVKYRDLYKNQAVTTQAIATS